jgi:glycosyltransferase involved in cell wall biosynthesis
VTGPIQLLREWPPGYGGVERVAHGLAAEQGGTVFSLRGPLGGQDPLSVHYQRLRIRCWPLGRLLLPLPLPPVWALLLSSQPLLAHLPCPTVLLLAVLARALRPSRAVSFYWHAFLAPRPGLLGCFEGLYQRLALRLLRPFPVVATSPVVVAGLQQEALPAPQLACLPCALTLAAEESSSQIWQRRQAELSGAGRLIAIGRLDSYKRFDWLLRAAAASPSVCRIDLVGDGPQRGQLEALARQLLSPAQRAQFHGRLDEPGKLQLLAQADLLVLPADRCNEAFGLVQLEAMACGIPALAFDVPRSGMHWVSRLPALPWHGDPSELPLLFQRLFSDRTLYRQVCVQARQRYLEEFSLPVWRERLATSARVTGWSRAFDG